MGTKYKDSHLKGETMHGRRGDVHAENIGTYSLCDIMYMYDLTYCDI